MIDHLIARASSPRIIYKHDGHLLRQPLIITRPVTLNPVERAYYAVAGQYRSGYPVGGVTGGNGVWVGKRMRKYYMGATTVTRPGSQIWRLVTTAHDPELVFYQGNYAISARFDDASMSATQEAFLQLAGYRFEIPQTLRGETIVGATLSVIHGGTIIQHEDPYSHKCDLDEPTCFAANASQGLLPGTGGFREKWHLHIGVFGRLNDEPGSWIRDFQQEHDFDTVRHQGIVNDPPRSSRQLWYYDSMFSRSGYIPVSTAPWVERVNLNAAAVNAIISNNGGWIVLAPDVGYSSNDDADTSSDFPVYTPGSGYGSFWLCTSIWGYGLQLLIQERKI